MGRGKVRDFHCCATCIHFEVKKKETGRGVQYLCSRLGYETRTEYKFNCWTPKDHIMKLMEKEKGKNIH
jgi:hypothetical protein